MTIEELLQEMLEKHGDEWPRGTLNRLLAIQCKSSFQLGSLTQKERQEFNVFYKWALEMIKAGIASKQSQEEA